MSFPRISLWICVPMLLTSLVSPARMKDRKAGSSRTLAVRRLEQDQNDTLLQHDMSASLVQTSDLQGSAHQVDPLTAYGMGLLVHYGIHLSYTQMVAFKIFTGTIFGTMAAGALTRGAGEIDRVLLCRAWLKLNGERIFDALLKHPCRDADVNYQLRIRLAYAMLQGACLDVERAGFLGHWVSFGKEYGRAINIFDRNVIESTAIWTAGWHLVAGEFMKASEGTIQNVITHKTSEAAVMKLGAAVLITATFSESEFKIALCDYAMAFLNNDNGLESEEKKINQADFQSVVDFCRALNLWHESCPVHPWKEPPGFPQSVLTQWRNAFKSMHRTASAGKDWLTDFMSEDIDNGTLTQEAPSFMTHLMNMDRDRMKRLGTKASSRALDWLSHLLDEDENATAADLAAAPTFYFTSSNPSAAHRDLEYELVYHREHCFFPDNHLYLQEVSSVYQCALIASLTPGCGSDFWTNAGHRGWFESNLCWCMRQEVDGGKCLESNPDKRSGVFSTYRFHEFGDGWGTYGVGYHPCNGEGDNIDGWWRNVWTKIENATLDQCKQRCKDTTLSEVGWCNGFAWNFEKNLCHLKSSTLSDDFCDSPKTCPIRWQDAAQWIFFYHYKYCTPTKDLVERTKAQETGLGLRNAKTIEYQSYEAKAIDPSNSEEIEEFSLPPL